MVLRTWQVLQIVREREMGPMSKQQDCATVQSWRGQSKSSRNYVGNGQRGAPEWRAGMAAWCDPARCYGLPTWGAAWAGDSNLDARAAAEQVIAEGIAWRAEAEFAC
jgi:hypothetical protein